MLLMAKKGQKGKDVKFTPTKYHIQTVKFMKAMDLSNDFIRKAILKPNGEPLSLKTFENIFSDELEVAKAEIVAIASNVLFKMVRKGHPDYALKVFNLCTRKHRENKFDFDPRADIMTQLRQVMDAFVAGKIQNYEAETFIKAIDTQMSTKEADDQHYTITIDSESHADMQGLLTHDQPATEAKPPTARSVEDSLSKD